MSHFPPAFPHGPLREVFTDVFFVTGAMHTLIGGAPWQFSRNMTVVRDGDQLTLINAVRLDADGLAQLDRLGRVAHVVKLGALHGRDDPFYVAHHGATFWALPGMEHAEGLLADKTLVPGGEMPFSGCELFAFETTKLPEGILRVDRDGGILIACDSLQNWSEPDEFFADDTRRAMQDMGFFQPANLGPVWMQVNEPRADDFVRINQLAYRHLLSAHGVPLRDHARESFAATFQSAFAV
jgi:hypothetical protein